MNILENKDTRHTYMEQHLRMSIAFQLRLLRLQHQYSSADIVRLSEGRLDTQEVMRAEDWNMSFPSIGLLLELSKVYNVALSVKFTDFREVVDSIVPSFDEQVAPEPPTES